MIKRIHIYGIYGSGKTTLARKLSEILNIPLYSLDDIKYEIKYTKTRSVSERIKMVQDICKREKWITEGTWSNYADEAFKSADLLIYLHIPQHVCSYRILKRFMSRKRGKNDTIIEALKLIRQVNRYYSSQEPVSFHVHRELLEKYRRKLLVVKNNDSIINLIKKLTRGLQ